MISNLSQYINLLVLALVLAILVKLVVILKLGLRIISKRITSLIFLNIYTPPQHVLHSNSYNSLCFKIIDKANSESDVKIKEALHNNWRKPNLNAQQNHSALIFSLQLLFPLFFSVFVCLFVCFFGFFLFLFHLLFSLSLTLIIAIFYCLNYISLSLHLITNTLYHIFLFHLLFSSPIR